MQHFYCFLEAVCFHVLPIAREYDESGAEMETGRVYLLILHVLLYFLNHIDTAKL